ncbi:unnamed protein product [Meloidogyne enterolobii]|uniref:Uncharacterized protein n=1 Tax=Meloidogyne enterolobii TaxID=390850 RepID=A0ACB0YQG9_MELEN
MGLSRVFSLNLFTKSCHSFISKAKMSLFALGSLFGYLERWSQNLLDFPLRCSILMS